MSAYTEYIYSLEEKNEMDISPLWQGLQVMFYLFSIVSGLAIWYCLSMVMFVMEQNCILYAKVVFYEVTLNNSTEKLNVTYNIKSISSDFYDGYCNFAMYLPVVIVVFSSFFFVMFVICGRGGSGNRSIPNTWRLIMPTIFFNLICFVLSILIASTVHRGLKKFTESIAAQWHVKHLELNDLNSLQLDGQDIGEYMVQYTIASKQAVWMFALFWSLSFFWIFLRCLFNVDFQLVRTTIHIYPNNISVLYKYDKNRVKSSDTSSSDNESVDLASNKSLVRFRNLKMSPTNTRKSTNNSVSEKHKTSTSVKNISVVSPISLEIHKKTTDVISDSTTQPSNTAYQETNGPDDVIVDLDKDTWMADSSNKQTSNAK